MKVWHSTNNIVSNTYKWTTCLKTCIYSKVKLPLISISVIRENYKIMYLSCYYYNQGKVKAKRNHNFTFDPIKTEN